ncbi:MAG: methionine biosynthesis protein MetW, partial [Burkholderiaceae bacterium]|nr:methionine biosynthesis protein MetW [Burkholderiaceae bacterium]
MSSSESVLKQIAALVPAGSRVLDLGCGTGA